MHAACQVLLGTPREGGVRGPTEGFPPQAGAGSKSEDRAVPPGAGRCTREHLLRGGKLGFILKLPKGHRYRCLKSTCPQLAMITESVQGDKTARGRAPMGTRA